MGAATDFDGVLTGFAAFDEEALGRRWLFRDRPMDVRYALYRTLEDAQELYVEVAARPHPESRRILSLAERAFGDLRGLLVGLPADLLDRKPREGEWPLRETLRHVLVVERRYALQTIYAIERGDADSVRIPDDRLPTPAQMDVSGEVGAILDRIALARAETNRRLGDVAPAAMTRPTAWVHYDVDVRFRLHRFAAHVVEHTIQCEKTLTALGWRPTEGRRIARRVAALVGEIEGLGATDEAREMKAQAAERLASVSAS
jgi:DinB superfamily